MKHIIQDLILSTLKKGLKNVGMIFISALLFISVGVADAREIIDMAGRKVAIPDAIKKVYVPSPYGTYMVYSMDPTLLISFNNPSKEGRRYLHKAVQDLPVIGRIPGQDQQSSIEAVLKAKPDLVIMWSAKKTIVMDEKANDALNQLHLPIVYAVAESLNDYPDVYLFMGKLLGMEERARELSVYFQIALTEAKEIVDRIPKEKRPSVYYAEGADGLSTECNDSVHVELLQLAGDTNVHRCHTASHMGLEKISLEQLTQYNPEVILASEVGFYDKVIREKDPAWQPIKAVKEGKVYLIPKVPFNWFDRPPSFMRIIGLKWLMSNLYPSQYKADFNKEAREFYRIFLGVELSQEEMMRVISREASIDESHGVGPGTQK